MWSGLNTLGGNGFSREGNLAAKAALTGRSMVFPAKAGATKIIRLVLYRLLMPFSSICILK
jgi:hypothetical protein